MMTALWMLVSAAIGAAVMYMLDPRGGSHRRALVRDKFIKVGHEIEDTTEAVSEQVKDRAKGTVAEMKDLLQSKQVDDRTLEERVRAELGSISYMPGRSK